MNTPVPRLDEVNTEPGEPAVRRFVLLANAVFGRLARRDWRHQEKLPRTGGIVVVANHISYVDPVAVGLFVAYSGRWPRFLAKASLFKVFGLGRALTASGQIPVERHTRKANDALVGAIEAVRDGRAVVVYPEGTITDDPDLWPMAGKTGAARIAFATGCPVIPIGQWGAQDIMYGHKVGFPKFLPRKTFRMLVGDPVDLSDLATDGKVTSAAVNRATERIMAAITDLVAELRGLPVPDPSREGEAT